MSLFLVLNRHHNSYLAYEGKIDSLPGVITSRAFFSARSRALRVLDRPESLIGYFVMVDVDNFKEINDQRRHSEGDWAVTSFLWPLLFKGHSPSRIRFCVTVSMPVAGSICTMSFLRLRSGRSRAGVATSAMAGAGWAGRSAAEHLSAPGLAPALRQPAQGNRPAPPGRYIFPDRNKTAPGTPV